MSFGLLGAKLSPREKIKRARVQIQEKKPFFSYLVMHLKLIETDAVSTMGVDKYANLYYNPKWVDTLTSEELKGVIIHEVMHCALRHFERSENMNKSLSNIAQDLVTNDILMGDGVKLPEHGLIPTHSHTFQYGDYTVEGLNEKTSEEVYDELYRHLSDMFDKCVKMINQHLENDNIDRLDEHIFSGGDDDGDGDANGKNGNGTPDDNSPLSKDLDWRKIMIDASAFGKSQGHSPAGMDRIIGKLNETYIDWRGILYRIITSEIPVDFTWGRPSKRSQALGIYLPDVIRETVDISVAVDTSGSISQDELEEFMSEIVGIIGSFKNVNLTVIVCDADVHGVYKLRSVRMEDVVERVKLQGGGGTDHRPVFNWINEHQPRTKLLIAFTDGYTSFPDENEVKCRTIWVVAGEWRRDEKMFPFGEVVSLPKRRSSYGTKR